MGARSVAGGRPAARQLVRRARLELEAADACTDPEMGFRHAHMAAIRAASAVLALAAPAARGRRRQPLSVWEQLADVGQRWEEWAGFFAAGAPTRAAIESGRASGVDARAAQGLRSAVAEFADEVSAAVEQAERAVAAPIAS